MTNSVGFNPFTDTLAEGYRLRLLDGKLTVESADVRKGMGGWDRFWTRSEYSQSGILDEMNRLYKKQVGKDVNRETFTKNFETLEGRATAQNDEFKDVNPIVRFFEAKSFIDVAAFHKKFEKIDATFVKAEAQKMQAAQRQAQQEAAAQEALRKEQERQAQVEAQKQAARDEIQADLDARIKPIKDQLATFTKELKELENMSLEDYKKLRYDQLISEGKNLDQVQKAVEASGQMAYDQKISNLKARISLAEKAIELSEITQATTLKIQGL